MPESVSIDCAGAVIGGAARFLDELDLWLTTVDTPVEVIGRGQALTPGWLARRELLTSRHDRRVALNNVSFVAPGAPRVVLLRNALHFAAKPELDGLGYRMPRSIRAQVPIVRQAAKRADIVVVPCTTMGERVVQLLPSLSERIVVRPHPVSPRPWAGGGATADELLMPILNAPYKRLDQHLTTLLEAAAGVDSLTRIHVTAEAGDFPDRLASNPRINFLGRLSASVLDDYWRTSRAVYFPTQLESFGYPLAEARANGRRVVALDTVQNKEIAGPALAGFDINSVDSLAEALDNAMRTQVQPDHSTFDPDAYFRWLTTGVPS